MLEPDADERLDVTAGDLGGGKGRRARRNAGVDDEPGERLDGAGLDPLRVHGQVAVLQRSREVLQWALPLGCHAGKVTW